MKTTIFLKAAIFLLVGVTRILCVIKIMSLRSELVDHGCLGIGQGPDENTVSRKGWLMTSLFGSDSSTFITMSFGLWFKPTSINSVYSILVETSLLDTQGAMVFWHLGSERQIQLQLRLKNQYATYTYPASITYQDTWRSLIMHYNYNSGKAYMIVKESDGTTFLSQFNSPGPFRISEELPNSFLNANYAIQGADHLNACGKHKDLQFHYSVDLDYTAEDIHTYQFNRSTLPLFLFDFRIWNADSTTIQALSQEFKNLVSILDTGAINGSSTSISASDDVQFVVSGNKFISSFQPNQFISLPTIDVQYTVSISFIPFFNLGDFINDDQMRIFYQINPIIEVYLTYSSASTSLYLHIKIGTATSSRIPFGQRQVRHTIQFQRDDTTFTTTFVKYYVRGTLYSRVTIPSVFTFGGTAYLGQQLSGYIPFSLQDFLVFVNSQLGSPDIFSNDSDLLLPACDIQISFGVLSSQSYCLACSSTTQVPTTSGVCRNITASSLTNQLPMVVTPLLSSLLIQHIYSTSRSTSTFIDIQKSGSYWDFMVMGYFKLSTATINKPMSLILVEVPNQSYQFLHLMVMSDMSIKLKQLFNQEETYTSLPITYSTSLVERWVAIGLGYKSASFISFIVSDNPTQAHRFTYTQLSSSQVLDSTYSTLRINIAPSMTYSPWYSTFDGQSSTVKIIYSFDSSKMDQFSYLPEHDRKSTPLYNGITQQRYSEQLGNQYDIGCDANNGMYFEGTCIIAGNCYQQKTSVLDNLGMNNSFYDHTSSQSCRICDGNCQTCTISSTNCSSCRSGMYLDATTKVCHRCQQGKYFRSTSNNCISDCVSYGALTDYANRICVTIFDATTFTILPQLIIRQFQATIDQNFQILSTPLSASRITYSCWIQQDSPYPYSFLGSSSSQEYTFLWQNLPKNYAKEIIFILLLIDSSSLSDVTFLINGLSPEVSTSTISLSQPSMCYDQSMVQIGSTMTIYEVTLSLVNNSDNLELSISSTTQIIGIRNIKPIAKKCFPSCNSCSGNLYFDSVLKKCMPCDSSCLFCSGPAANQCTSCYRGMYLYNRVCYSSCASANSKMIENEWKRTCESPNEVTKLSVFFKQTDYYPEQISMYVRTSDSLNLDVLFACESSPVYNTLGLFNNQMLFNTPILGPHQAIHYSFLLYSKCLSETSCSMSVKVFDDDSSLKSISFAPTSGVCAISKLRPVSIVLNHQTAAVAAYQILISSSDLVFSVSSIQISTIICHITCESCDGPLITDCTSCPLNSTFDGATKKCVCLNPIQGLGTDDSIECTDPFSCLLCLPCVSPCATCFKTDSQSCNTCIAGKFLLSTYCVDSCPANTTIPVTDEITGTGVCNPCPSPCATCTLFGVCNSCIDGYSYVSDQKICVQVCPTQYYQNLNQCLPCLDSCNQCVGTLPTDCLVCNSGYFMNSTTSQCQKCSDECLTCTGSLSSDCVDCAPGMMYFKPYPNLSLHYCTSSCIEVPGFYSSYPACLPCNSTCSVCSGSGISECSECIDGYYLSQGSCLQCNNQCLTCTGSSSNNCSSCVMPLYLNGSQCSGNCLKGTYGARNPISGTFSCNTCPTTCSACESDRICTSCQIGYYLSDSSCLKCENNCQVCYSDQGKLCQKCNKGFYLQQQLCYSECPSLNGIGYYGDSITRMCKVCDSSCKTCLGQFSLQCLSCNKGYYLASGSCLSCPINSLSCFFDATSNQLQISECIQGLFLYSGSCYSACLQGTYQKGIECFDCDISCRSCLDGTNAKCQMCAKGYTLLDNSQTCQACSVGGEGMGDCELCSSIDVCDKCTSLILFNNKCLLSCPATYYQDSGTQMCKKCLSPCLECSGSLTCTTCADGYFLSGTTCLKCNAVCSTCTGGESTNCKLCMSGLLVQKRTNSSLCTKTCDVGFYADTALKVCSACDQSCSTCQDSNSCDLCRAGYFKNGDKLCALCSQNCIRCTTGTTCQECNASSFLFKGACISSCPAGTIGIGSLCVPCISECLECSGSISTCSKCPIGTFLFNSRCFACDPNCNSCTSSTVCTACKKGLFLQDGICQIQCTNSGTYSDTTTMTCQPCDANCAECNGPFSRQCASCAVGKYLARFDESMISGSCESCHTSCKSCFGSSNTKCNSCAKGVKYNSASTTCIPNQSSFYFDQTTQASKKCSSICYECNGPDSSNCLSCKDKYYLIQNESTCTLCPDSCSKCTSDTKCLACAQGYSLFQNTSCLKECPSGMRIQNGVCSCHSTCAKCDFNEITNVSVCKKCINSNLYLVSNTPSCIEKSACTGFTDEQTSECLDSCPDSKFVDRKNKTCSSNPCPGDTFTLSNKYCVETCPYGTFANIKNKICVQCDSKCNTCIGSSDSECTSCTQGKYFHKSLASCKDECIIGYIQEDLAILECTLCQTNCKICQSDLYSFERTCVTECPIGYKVVAKKCIKDNTSRVRIKKSQSSKISTESDLEIEAELSTNFSNPTVTWKNIYTTDQNFSKNFLTIASDTLVQFIPYLLFTSENKYKFQISVSLPDGTLLTDEISFETDNGIKQGQFIVDKSTGVANLTPFNFQFKGWTANQPLFFSLNFYELVGLISSANLTSDSPSDYLKENLFQLHQNTTLYTSNDVQIQITFPAFNRDINMIAELHVHNSNNTMRMFSYLMIDLKADSSTDDKISSLQNSLDSITEATNQIKTLFYAMNFNQIIPLSNDKLVTITEQQNLRIQARRMRISTAELADCDSSIDCFDHGQCVQDLKYLTFTCNCDGEYTGTNCEWSLKQASMISDSVVKLTNLLPNLGSPSIQLQIVEILISYSTYFGKTSNLSYLVASTISILSSTIEAFFAITPDEVTGQMLSRCFSTSISTLKSIGQNVEGLLKLQSKYSHYVSNNLNVGQNLVTSSESYDSLLQPISKSKLKQSKVTDSYLEVNIQDLQVQFPPAVVQNNKKQVVQVSKWKKPSRSNPNAISQAVSISMSQEGSEVSVNNLSAPIIFTLPKLIPSPVSSNPEAIICTYYDENTDTFSSEGCTFVKETIVDVVCSCTHLTDFQAASNPQAELEAVSISTFLDTVKSGKKIILSKQNTKQVVSKLPTIKLGNRSSSLTSQLVNLVTPKIQIQKQVTILTENESLKFENFSFEDKIDILLVESNNTKDENTTISKSVWELNKKYFLIYSLCIIVIAIFLSLRSYPSLKFIQIEEENENIYDEQQLAFTVALAKENIQRKKEEILKKKLKRDKKKLGTISITQEQVNKEPKKQIKLSFLSGKSRTTTSLVKQNITKYEIDVIQEAQSEESQRSSQIGMQVGSNNLIQFSNEQSLISFENGIKELQSNKRNQHSDPQKTNTSQMSIQTSFNIASASDKFEEPKKQKKKSTPRSQKHSQDSNKMLQLQSPINKLLSQYIPFQKEVYQFEVSNQKSDSHNPRDESRLNLKMVQSCHKNIYSVYKDALQKHEQEDPEAFKELPKFEKQFLDFEQKYLSTHNNQPNETSSKNNQVHSQAHLYLSLIEKRQIERKKLQGLKNKEVMRVKTEQSENERMVTELSNEFMIMQQVQIKKEIEKSKHLIQALTNSIHSILGISLSEIFQISSLMKSYERLFSNNFTKCVQISNQISLTLFVNLIYKALEVDEDTQVISELTLFELVSKKRVLVSFLFGYAIPFFFFGLLTNIFAKSSKQVDVIPIRRINQMRSRFVMLYSVLGGLMFGASIAGIILLTPSQIEKIEISLAIEEVLLALLIQFIIIDGLCCLIAFFINNISDKISMFHYLIACRGYYYFEGFDNLKAYEYYYRHESEKDSSLRK